MQRDEKGRFVAGNSAAKGNHGGRPPRKREERYYEITISACTFDEWQRIVKKAVQQALRGDATARKWLADYIVGVPEQNINIGGGLVLEYVNDWRGPVGDADD